MPSYSSQWQSIVSQHRQNISTEIQDHVSCGKPAHWCLYQEGASCSTSGRPLSTWNCSHIFTCIRSHTPHPTPATPPWFKKQEDSNSGALHSEGPEWGWRWQWVQGSPCKSGSHTWSSHLAQALSQCPASDDPKQICLMDHDLLRARTRCKLPVKAPCSPRAGDSTCHPCHTEAM